MKIKIIGLIALLTVLTLGVGKAQTSYAGMFYNNYNTTNILTRDTVTNVASINLRSKFVSGWGNETTITVTLTRASGAMAGTVSIEGSLSGTGTDWHAINTQETQTAMATATFTDVASKVLNWRINKNPYSYYRVVYSQTSTGVAYLENCRILKH